MIKKIYFAIILLILLHWLSYSQTKGHEDNFNHVVFIVKGDLNKDNIADSVVVMQDTLNDLSPYRLKIYLTNADRKYFLSVRSDSAIEPQFPDGKEGFRYGTSLNDITIASGALSIICELTRGHYEHKFRYQNGNFELIGFTEVNSDGHGNMYTTDFNLSTGVLVEISQRIESDKLLSKKRKIVKIRPLPKLQNFKPFLSDIY
ncbi:MAG: hypothetical protein JWN83_2890 [Chitinophagaceae bacterium]|nr:hypothetical protein [Chitinophagaceae bacterium]